MKAGCPAKCEIATQRLLSVEEFSQLCNNTRAEILLLGTNSLAMRKLRLGLHDFRQQGGFARPSACSQTMTDSIIA